MHDGISVEERGKPSVVVVGRDFVTVADGKRRFMGALDYRFVVIPSPLGDIPEVHRKAEQALPHVVEALVEAEVRV